MSVVAVTGRQAVTRGETGDFSPLIGISRHVKNATFSAKFWIVIVIDLKHIFSLTGLIYNVIHLY